MTQRQLKTGCFVLTALNTLGSCYFLNYLYFYLRDTFAFDNRQNLWVSALYGFTYIFAAWQCGKFAQRHGALKSIRLGLGSMTVLLAIGGFLRSPSGVLCILAGFSVVLLFTWPALEAMVSESETRAGVQHMVGVYNCTWSAAAALAYFTEGKLYGWLGRATTIFWVPAGIFFVEFWIAQWLSRQAVAPAGTAPDMAQHAKPHPEPVAFQQQVNPQAFLKMSWLSNPFAYVAINTILAVMPGIATQFDLSSTQVGLFCSIWFFGRFAAFVVLWKWTGWHYRFRWLLSAFVILVVGFVILLEAPNLWIFALAQIFFGLAAGLIYYSSLFYSMDLGQTKAEHGGLHEAAIGAGLFMGPAVGAASLQFIPRHSSTGVYAVTLLLLIGFTGLVTIWFRERNLRLRNRPLNLNPTALP